MTTSEYSTNVFINCPFDDEYADIRDALVFAVYDCGFVPRCALEEDDGGVVRFTKIQKLITESKYGIHDICRTELDPVNHLPRFNMPLELGVFLGARQFGNKQQEKKNCLILDTEQYRFQRFISDIAGHDPRAHEGSPENAIVLVRNWLNTASGRKTIPGGKRINRRFELFRTELPQMCDDVFIQIDELTYNDYSNFVSEWLQDNP